MEDGTSRGVLLGYPLVNTRVELVPEACEVDQDSTPVALRTACALVLADALRSAAPRLLEPIMNVEVVTSDRTVGDVLSDLTAHRQARVLVRVLLSASHARARSCPSLPARRRWCLAKMPCLGVLLCERWCHFPDSLVRARTVSSPMLQGLGATAHMLPCAGYATSLRSVTGGQGSFSMELFRYGLVSDLAQKQLLSRGY